MRPLLLITVLLMLINKVDNLDELSMVPLGTWFGTVLNLGQLCWSLAIVYLLMTASGPLAMVLSLLLGRVLNLTEGSRRGLTLVIRYTIVGFGLIWALDHSGFDRTAILAIAGGLSVGLGFGIKEVIANFISELWLLFEGSVRPGEVLYIDEDPCEVRRLGLRAALLWRDRDNTELLVPNQLFFSTTTTTFTGSDGMRRCQVQVMAAYRHRPRDVMALMVQTVAVVPQVLAKPAPIPLILDYGDSGVLYAVRFWIARPMEGTVVSIAVREAIWEAFAANAIEIPYPQRVLHQA
ncbi:MAG: mechanosensitive ion channel [Cyanobacteria bacterium K_DeepCast_35m_m2_023]|nr:mechanosensitive ion channel [Cyanobacteria bacterium K_DeepCast_35m_m2_023]